MPNDNEALDNKVVNINYAEGAKVEIEIAASNNGDFYEEIDEASSVTSVLENWKQKKLSDTYPQTDALIKKYAEDEQKYGVSMNINIIKLEIKRYFAKEKTEYTD